MLLFTVCLIVLIATGVLSHAALGVLEWTGKLGVGGPIVLCIIITVLIPTLLPSTILNVGAGFLFKWTGFPVTLVASLPHHSAIPPSLCCRGMHRADRYQAAVAFLLFLIQSLLLRLTNHSGLLKQSCALGSSISFLIARKIGVGFIEKSIRKWRWLAVRP